MYKPTGFWSLDFSELGVFDGIQKLGNSLSLPSAIFDIEEVPGSSKV